ncbi:MAG: TIGR02556 family CRISPR-associated protein [Thermoplasmata archaeon]
MIQELYKIGQILTSEEEDSILKYIDRSKLRNSKKVLLITFNICGDSINYLKIDVEDYDNDKAIRYLYSPGDPNGTDLTPTSIITEPEKTFKNKILKWFINYEERDKEFIGKISREIQNKKDKILEDLLEKYKELTEKERKNPLLTIKFKENSVDKYLYDFKIFRDILIESAKNRYKSRKSMGESKGEGTCYLCGQNKEVFGFVLPALGLSFSTADKEGFIGGFKKENRWKEIPICENCASILAVGKKFMDENLSFKFLEYNYFVIPSVILGSNEKDILDEFKKQVNYNKGKEYHQGLVSDEDYISDYVSEKSNAIRLIFIFYTKKGGGKYLDIIKMVEDVLPSQLKRIKENQKIVRNRYGEEVAKKIFGKNVYGDIVYLSLKNIIEKEEYSDRNNWYLSIGKNFFKDKKDFLYYISNILNNRPINRSFLISTFIKAIRTEYRNKQDYLFKLKSIQSLMIYELLIDMGIMGGEKMDEKKETVIGGMDPIEEFFDTKQKAFPNIQSKASFLVGALVNYLLWVQRSERDLDYGEEPFRSKLYGLNIDESKIKKIYREAVEKLAEYGRSTILQEYTAKYLCDAGYSWNLSKDEISYYFSLGLALGHILYKKENLEDDKNGSKE